jgi:hypothetical protein
LHLKLLSFTINLFICQSLKNEGWLNAEL